MSIQFSILGEPGRDNGMVARVDTGQAQHRLLFDCGQGVLDELPVPDVARLDAVFFSHFHMDHVSGFDTLLRFNWDRHDPPLSVYGPPGAIALIQHRLQGFLWDLVEGLSGEWLVHEIGPEQIRSARFLTREGFAVAHSLPDRASDGVIRQTADFTVRARALRHSSVSMAYTIHEASRINVDTNRLSELGLSGGPWLKTLKDPEADGDTMLEVGGVQRSMSELRGQLLATSPGESLAYLTDFCLDLQSDEAELIEFLAGCQTIVCENNYADEDEELARKHRHMTSTAVAQIAERVQPDRLVLFHLSDRYTSEQWQQQLERVREIFPRTEWPSEWQSRHGLKR